MALVRAGGAGYRRLSQGEGEEGHRMDAANWWPGPSPGTAADFHTPRTESSQCKKSPSGLVTPAGRLLLNSTTND